MDSVSFYLFCTYSRLLRLSFQLITEVAFLEDVAQVMGLLFLLLSLRTISPKITLADPNVNLM